jgi:hypothetical protein
MISSPAAISRERGDTTTTGREINQRCVILQSNKTVPLPENDVLFSERTCRWYLLGDYAVSPIAICE